MRAASSIRSAALRRRLLALVAVGVFTGGGLTACATGPRQITVSDEQLSARLAGHFPLERRWLDVFDLRLADPQVRTLPASQRVRVDIDLRLGDRLFSRRFAARLALEARVRFEPSDDSLRMHEVTVDAFTVDGADAQSHERIGRLPALLVAPWLEDATLYRLSDAQRARLQREGWAVQAVTVTGEGLSFTVAPRR